MLQTNHQNNTSMWGKEKKIYARNCQPNQTVYNGILHTVAAKESTESLPISLKAFYREEVSMIRGMLSVHFRAANRHCKN